MFCAYLQTVCRLTLSPGGPPEGAAAGWGLTDCVKTSGGASGSPQVCGSWRSLIIHVIFMHMMRLLDWSCYIVTTIGRDEKDRCLGVAHPWGTGVIIASRITCFASRLPHYVLGMRSFVSTVSFAFLICLCGRPQDVSEFRELLCDARPCVQVVKAEAEEEGSVPTVHEAAATGDLEELNRLLDGNERLGNSKDDRSKTALHWVRAPPRWYCNIYRIGFVATGACLIIHPFLT
jgi:hypothetical protein